MDNSSLEPQRTVNNEFTPHSGSHSGSPRDYQQSDAQDGHQDEIKATQFSTLWRRYWKIPVTLGVVLAVVTFIGSSFIHEQFEASAQVAIQSPASPQNAGGNDQLKSLVSAFSGPSSDISSEIATMTSDDVLRTLSGRLNLSMPPYKIRQRIKIVQDPLSDNMVNITARGRSRQQAVDMVYTLLNVDSDKLKDAAFSANNHSTVVLHQMVAEEAGRAETADTAYSKYRKQVGSVDVVADTTETAKQLGVLQTALDDAHGKSAIADAEQRFYNSQVSRQPGAIIQGLIFAENPRIREDETTLGDLESQKAVLARNYTSRDQQMQQVDQKIDAMKSDMVRERDSENHIATTGLAAGPTTTQDSPHPLNGDWVPTGGSEAPNPGLLATKAALVEARARAEASKAESGAIQKSLQDLHHTIAGLPSQQQRLLELEDDAITSRKVYDGLRAQLAVQETQERLQQPYLVVFQAPILPKYQSWPFPGFYAAGALLLGLIIGIAAMYLIDANDSTIYDSNDSFKTVVPILSHINRDNAHVLPDIKEAFIRTQSTESYEALASTLTYMGLGRTIRTLMVTSPALGDGVTYTASQLALTLSKVGIHVILVDANVRNPSLHALFGTKNNEGLAGLMRNGMNTDAALVPVDQETALQLIPGGETGDGTYGLPSFFDSNKVALLMKSLKDKAAVVIVDAPPVSSGVETAALADKVDGILLVFRSGVTRNQDAERATNLLGYSGARVLGCVLNDPLPKTGAKV